VQSMSSLDKVGFPLASYLHVAVPEPVLCTNSQARLEKTSLHWLSTVEEKGSLGIEHGLGKDKV
jgi:hypothetical protein